MTHHGQVDNEIFSPRSKFYQGPYGRMFRNLPPYVPTIDLLKGQSIPGLLDEIAIPLREFLEASAQEKNDKLNSLKEAIKHLEDRDNVQISESERNILDDTKMALQDTEAGREAILKLLARTMIEEDDNQPETGDNDCIPAGYTYFSQFITHDITFDPTSSLMRFNDPDKIRNFRTPRLDLDSLYGGGPITSPFLYENIMTHKNKGTYGKFLIGKNQDIEVRATEGIKDINIRGHINGDEVNEEITGQNASLGARLNVTNLVKVRRVEKLETDEENLEIEEFSEDDLPRNIEGRALIADPRNDEIIMISQLHLAFMKFHNKILDDVIRDEGLKGRRAFQKAQQLVRWHYQYVILNDFLPKLVDCEILKKIWDSSDCPGKPKLCFYQWREKPFIPVEFSVAAFRFGHSMIRNKYTLNFHRVTQRRFILLSPELMRRKSPAFHLLGFRRLIKHWTIQWDRFFDIDDSSEHFQRSRKIDTRLSFRLNQLPLSLSRENEGNLAARDLLRGYKMGLPSGQAVARAIGITPLDDHDKEEPLWYYILREAEELGKRQAKDCNENSASVQPSPPLGGEPSASPSEETGEENTNEKGGYKLGPVGSHIVAEVIIGLVTGDPHSYLNINPEWHPAYSPGELFELRDILKHAGVPLSKEGLKEKFRPSIRRISPN